MRVQRVGQGKPLAQSTDQDMDDCVHTLKQQIYPEHCKHLAW